MLIKLDAAGYFPVNSFVALRAFVSVRTRLDWFC